jgi:hypothetical protein
VGVARAGRPRRGGAEHKQRNDGRSRVAEGERGATRTAHDTSVPPRPPALDAAQNPSVGYERRAVCEELGARLRLRLAIVIIPRDGVGVVGSSVNGSFPSRAEVASARIWTG